MFTPVLIHNNSSGDADARILARFEEPAWNNPVVRWLDREGNDLAPRLHRQWTVARMAEGMVAALDKCGARAPAWLRLLRDARAAHRRGVETAVFGMGWFWVGEAEFGLVHGVLATRSGWLEGHEVVEVTFDPRLLPFPALLDRARAADCARQVYTTTDQQLTAARKVAGDRARARPAGFRPDDLKYYLGRTALAHLPMTALQAARINGSLGADGWQKYLSPGQLQLLARIEKAPGKGYPVAIGVEFVAAMKALPQ